MTLLHQLVTWLRSRFPPTYHYPAVDIRLTPGRQLHLVGSLHMGSVGMSPLPDGLLLRLRKATALVVEVDVSCIGSPYTDEHDDTPVMERLSLAHYQQFQQLCNTYRLDEHRFDPLPAWQIALMLQAVQAQALGLRPDYGIDYQLIQAAKAQGIPVIELEGQQVQINLLRQLPLGGIVLLEDTLTHWHVNARLLQKMTGWWLSASPGILDLDMPKSVNHDLSDLLLGQRNQRWCTQLRALPQGSYVIAVGALHLYSDDNLPALLRA